MNLPPTDTRTAHYKIIRRAPPMSMKRVWVEDDATIHDPLHEDFKAAFKRLSGREFDSKDALSTTNVGDATIYEMPGGFLINASYPGASIIYFLS